MLKPYDMSSPVETLSMYSQPMTRASSSSGESETVITPQDILQDRPYKTLMSGPRQMGHNSDVAQARSTGLDIRQEYFDERHSTQAISKNIIYDDEPHSSYFSLAPNPASRNGGLTRQKTAKELISRFESIDSSEKSASTTRSSISRPQPSHANSTSTSCKSSSRSPIRRSFHNLLSVFSKKHKASNKATNIQLSVPTNNRYGQGASTAPMTRTQLPLLSIPENKGVLSSRGTSSHGVRDDICITPISLHTGPLLHLSCVTSSTVLPVWTNCTAVLHSTHILITSLTAHGNPRTHVVPFTGCTDVRSLSLADLNTDERGLLPAQHNAAEYKIFEILFEGRARETFAATSVSERAGWVSAIWDVVLQAQENRTTPSMIETHSALGFTMNDPISSQDTSSREQGNSYHDSETRRWTPGPRSSTHDKERALPPIPSAHNQMSRSPVRISLHDPPVPRPSPPVTPIRTLSAFSSLSTPPQCRSQSPSIRNLDQRSVVKQRLAELERTNSTASASSLLNRPTSTPVSDLKHKPGSMQRHKSAFSAVNDSIIDSYGGGFAESPLSMHSGRLTSIGSVREHRSSVKPIIMHAASPLSHDKMRTEDHLFAPSPRYAAVDVPPVLRLQSSIAPIDLDDPHLQPLAQLVHDHAGRQLEQGANIEMQIATLQDQISSLPQEVKMAIEGNDSSTQPEVKLMLQEISHTIKGLEAFPDGMHSNGVNTKIDLILEEVRGREAAQGEVFNVSRIMEKLEEMRTELKMNLIPGGSGVVTMRNAKPSSSGDETSLNAISDSPGVQSRLDALFELCRGLQSRGTGPDSEGNPLDGQSVPEEMHQILALLKEDHTQRSIQMEQQTDSVRYLNDLNSWLETFVNHGTAQIETVAAGVQQLCKDLGPATEALDAEGQPVEGGSILTDIRQLLIGNKERDQNAAALHGSVNSLVAVVQEDMRRNSEARNVLTTESVVGLIDRQRQDQEHLLRNLAIELSNDIRGERLRFVEAMKEATAINVQIHVEEFKKELTREVLVMTQEVGRLQRERQGLEQQIADLFSFYAKQKQAGTMFQPSVPTTHRRRAPSQPQVILPTRRGTVSSARRPLPTPTPKPGSSFM